MCGGNGRRPSLGWVDRPKRAMALGPSHAQARVSGELKQNTGPGPSRPSRSAMSVLRRLQHGAGIEDRYPERVDFEKSPWGNSWVTASPSPSKTTWREAERARGEPAYLSGEHQSRLPLLELHSALHGGNLRFSSSARRPASAPRVITASTWASSGVGRPSSP